MNSGEDRNRLSGRWYRRDRDAGEAVRAPRPPPDRRRLPVPWPSPSPWEAVRPAFPLRDRAPRRAAPPPPRTSAGTPVPRTLPPPGGSPRSPRPAPRSPALSRSTASVGSTCAPPARVKSRGTKTPLRRTLEGVGYRYTNPLAADLQKGARGLSSYIAVSLIRDYSGHAIRGGETMDNEPASATQELSSCLRRSLIRLDARASVPPFASHRLDRRTNDGGQA
jgi:hypothetical protein